VQTATLTTPIQTISHILTILVKQHFCTNRYMQLRIFKLYYYFGLASIVFSSIISIIILYYEQTSYTFFLIFLLFIAGFIPGIMLILFYRNHRVCFNDKTITASSCLVKQKQINWDEINSIKYSLLSGSLKLKAKNKTISISKDLAGLDEFLEIEIVLFLAFSFKEPERRLYFMLLISSQFICFCLTRQEDAVIVLSLKQTR
jgi:hypothetical protein